MGRTRRPRVRASDIAAPNPRRGLMTLAVLVIALTIVIVYKVSVGEETASFMEQVTGDPNLILPPSVTSRDAGLTPDG